MFIARLHQQHRARWAALGAAVAVTLGAGGIGLVDAAVTSGDKPVYQAVTPCRVTDTRPDFNVGDQVGPIGADTELAIGVHGDPGECVGIPSDAVAIALNITALDATMPTFLTVWPDEEDRPNSSSLNPSPGQPPVPNAVVTDLSDDGVFRIYNFQGDVHVVVDIVGFYADHHHDDRYYTKAEIDAMPTGSSGPWTGADIVDQSIKTPDIADEAITAVQIADNTITDVQIEDDSVTSKDLWNEAGQVSSNATGAFTGAVGATVQVRKQTIMPPGPGTIVAMVSGSFISRTGGLDAIACDLTTDELAVSDPIPTSGFGFGDGGAATDIGIPFSTVKSTGAAGGTPVTIYLYCHTGIGEVSVHNVNMSLLYLPTTYLP